MRYCVLIAEQGTGTNLFRKILNTHPDINFAGEVFDKELFALSGKDLQSYLDAVFEKHTGFDLKYAQTNNLIFSEIKRRNLAVIHILRDPVRTYISQHRVGSWQDIRLYAKRIESYRKLVKKKFPDCFEIYYEEMTRGRIIGSLPPEIETRLQKFLNL